jgi:hypothetical protein
MTSVIRRVAGGLSILESAWVIFIQLTATPYSYSCSLNLCQEPQFNPAYSQALLLLAVVLIVAGLVGIWGSWFAYPTGALFSAILLAAMGYSAWAESAYTYLIGEESQALIGAALAAIALLANLIAWRAKTVLSEQANPMNLPVFG